MKLVKVLDLCKDVVRGDNPHNAQCIYHLTRAIASAPDVEVPVIPLPTIEGTVEISLDSEGEDN